MANLQVKGLDDRLYKALRARAELDNRSMSQEIVTIVEEFLSRGMGDPGKATEAFLEIAGTWEDERPAEEIAAEIRKSRRGKSRAKRVRDVFA
jgi:plasmid stability protein